MLSLTNMLLLNYKTNGLAKYDLGHAFNFDQAEIAKIILIHESNEIVIDNRGYIIQKYSRSNKVHISSNNFPWIQFQNKIFKVLNNLVNLLTIFRTKDPRNLRIRLSNFKFKYQMSSYRKYLNVNTLISQAHNNCNQIESLGIGYVNYNGGITIFYNMNDRKIFICDAKHVQIVKTKYFACFSEKECIIVDLTFKVINVLSFNDIFKEKFYAFVACKIDIHKNMIAILTREQAYVIITDQKLINAKIIKSVINLNIDIDYDWLSKLPLFEPINRFGDLTFFPYLKMPFDMSKIYFTPSKKHLIVIINRRNLMYFDTDNLVKHLFVTARDAFVNKYDNYTIADIIFVN